MSESSAPGASDDEAAASYQEAVRRGVPLRESDGTLIYPTARSRPKPNFVLDPLHRALMLISVTVPVLLTVFIATQMPTMPERVPVQFGLDGSVNRYGSPWEGLWTAVGAAAVIIGVAVLARFPRVFNYPVELTGSNVQAQYKNAVQMMVWLNVSMAVMAMGLTALWIDLLWVNLAWVGLVLMGASLVFFIRRMLKLR